MTIPGYDKFLEHLQSEHIASHQRMEEAERRADEWRRCHPPKPLKSVEEIIGKPEPQYIELSPPQSYFPHPVVKTKRILVPTVYTSHATGESQTVMMWKTVPDLTPEEQRLEKAREENKRLRDEIAARKLEQENLKLQYELKHLYQ